MRIKCAMCNEMMETNPHFLQSEQTKRPCVHVGASSNRVVTWSAHDENVVLQMSVYHGVQCDACGVQGDDDLRRNSNIEEIRTRLQLTFGWWRDGAKDYCSDECRANAVAEKGTTK